MTEICFVIVLFLGFLLVTWCDYLQERVKMLEDDAAFWERQCDKRRDLFESYYKKVKALKQSGIISNRVARKYEL